MFRILAAVLICMFAGGPACARDKPMLWDVNGQGHVRLAAAAMDFPRGGLVFVGEHHDNKAHHEAQLDVIRAAREAGLDLAVGLEMFQRRNQEYLDRWVAGDIGSSDMGEVFTRNWGHKFELYQPIFEYCRDNSIPMLGLNVPGEITRKVSRQGFESLTEEERDLLPPITCEVGPEYEEFLRRVSGHGHDPAGGFQRFCQAQLVWDTAMAIYALEFLKERPKATVIVLCGSIHAWKPAIPRQVERRAPDTPRLVIQPYIGGQWDKSNTRPVDADYLFMGR